MKRTISYFTPQNKGTSNRELAFLQSFIKTSLLAIVVLIVYAAMFTLIDFYLSGLVCIISALVLIFFLAVQKRRVNKKLGGTILIVIAYISVLVSTAQSGSILSPIVAWFTFPSIIALNFLGRKASLFWLLVSLVTIVILVILNYFEVNNDRVFNKSYKLLVYTILSVGYIALNFLIILIYERQKLRSEALLIERNKDLKEQHEEITTIVEMLERDKKIIQQQKNSLEESLEEQRVLTEQVVTYSNEIDEKNKEITDSIRYAQRIQRAILPTDKRIKELLNEHFVLNLPRDIVSGDFYWLQKHENTLAIAVADCTGHGVPGAFMSMLGVAFLNNIMSKKWPCDANEVLDDLRNEVKVTLGHGNSSNASTDGMDIAFCIINLDTNVVQFAGAHNPLFVIRDKALVKVEDAIDKTEGEKNVIISEANGYYLSKIKADNQPIGIYPVEHPFVCNKFKLLKGDKLYMFSDGYTDQIGGPKNKRFMSKNFKKLLLDIHHLPMDHQKEILLQKLSEWRQNHDQMDDILVLGLEL